MSNVFVVLYRNLSPGNQELVDGGIMNEMEIQVCFMRGFYYMTRAKIGMEYHRHLLGVHAAWDLEQAEII